MPDEIYINTPFSKEEHKLVTDEAKKDKRVMGRQVQVLAIEAIKNRKKRKSK